MQESNTNLNMQKHKLDFRASVEGKIISTNWLKFVCDPFTKYKYSAHYFYGFIFRVFSYHFRAGNSLVPRFRPRLIGKTWHWCNISTKVIVCYNVHNPFKVKYPVRGIKSTLSFQGEYGNFLLLVVLYIMAILKLNANLWLTNSVNKIRLNAFDAILLQSFFNKSWLMLHRMHLQFYTR